MTTQQIASIARQVLAVAAVVMGAITASVPSLHLPVAVSSVLAAIGGIILAVEHYVSDPSTGTATGQGATLPPQGG
jgi:hypothetical protein